MPIHESDVCVIGGGITAAMVIERLAELKPGLTHHRCRGRPIDLRSREPRHLPSTRHRVRRASVARRLHRGSAGQRHDLDDDGGWWTGAALGRRVQPVFRGGSPPQVVVRPRGRLGDRLARAGKVLRPGRASPERRRRSESVSGRSAVWALSSTGDAVVLQPAGPEEVGRAKRAQIFAAADVAQRQRARSTAAAPAGCTTRAAMSARPARVIHPTTPISS